MQLPLVSASRPEVVIDWCFEHLPDCLDRRADFCLDDFQSLDSPGRHPTGGARTTYLQGFGYIDHGYHLEL